MVIGKPLGITLFSYIIIKLRLGTMPNDMTFHELIGVGLLAGIGFTMSLFIALLGFRECPQFIDSAKIAILFSSIAAAILGMLWLRNQSKSQLKV